MLVIYLWYHVINLADDTDFSDNGSSKETESTGSAIGTDSETEGNAL